MKRFTLLFIAMAIAGVSSGQLIEKQAGIRMGNTSGFFIKAIKNENMAFEGMLGFRQGGAQLIGLIEQYKPVFTESSDHFRIYYGPGVHIGFVSWHDYHHHDRYPYYSYSRNYYAVIGIDGIIGLEYKFHGAPIVLAADFKPFFELESFYRPRLNLWDFGFSVSYSF